MSTFDWRNFDIAADAPSTLAGMGFDEACGLPASPALPEPETWIWTALCVPPPAVMVPASSANRRGTLMLIDEAAGSQFDALSRLPGPRVDDLRAPVIANAAMGRSFHGNRGRPWHAARGNLHLSALFPCDLDIARCGSLVSAAACLAVCDAIRDITSGGVRPEIKWVNDVRIGAAKVSGILTTARALEGRMRSIIFGIGLNVASQPSAVEPTAFVPAITHLAAHAPGLTPGRAWWALVGALLARFDQLAGAPGEIVSDYRRQCGAVGRAVRLYAEDVTNRMETLKAAAPLARGRVARLDDSLGVVLEGSEKVWTSGRLAYEDECVALGL
jgi:biotin-(acetyl-CoA carboxylase) ligase